MRILLVSLLLFSFSLLKVNAQTTITVGSTVLTEREVAIDLEVPWELQWGQDDFLWLTERPGRVLRIDPASGNQQVILDIEEQVSNNGEAGLLGLVSHPNFSEEPYIYLAYNYLIEGEFFEKLKIERYTWNGSTLEDPLVLIEGMGGGNKQNGCRLIIANDLKLYASIGDAGIGDNAQSEESNNGKILRLNLDGSIPVDNPISNSYIFTSGHRNPQGLCQSTNNTIYSSEHGAQASDELNILEAGGNYGWPFVEGECNTTPEINFCTAMNPKEPLLEWTPNIALNDLVYYDHPAIPEFQNSLLMAVLGGSSATFSQLKHMPLSTTGEEVIAQTSYFTEYGRIRDVCFNPTTGAIYFATNGFTYPGEGPNRIIEYRNLDYTGTGIMHSNEMNAQFLELKTNPVNRTIELELSNTFLGSKIQLFSYNGQLILEHKVNSTSLSLPVQHLNSGAYFISVSNKNGRIAKTVLIEH